MLKNVSTCDWVMSDYVSNDFTVAPSSDWSW